MPNPGDRFVDLAADAVRVSQRPVVGQGVPGIEGKVLGERAALGRVALLDGDVEDGDALEGRHALVPDDGRVLGQLDPAVFVDPSMVVSMSVHL